MLFRSHVRSLLSLRALFPGKLREEHCHEVEGGVRNLANRLIGGNGAGRVFDQALITPSDKEEC